MAKRIALIYLAAGSLWICLSDYILSDLTGEVISISPFKLQIIKGICFILATTYLIYFLLKNLLQEKLEAANDMTQLFLENPTPMFIYNLYTMEIIDANDAAINFYKYDKEEFIGLNVWNLVAASHVTESLKYRDKALEGSYISILSLHKSKFGCEKYVKTNSHPFTYKNIKSRLVIIWDVDKAHRTEQKNIELNEKIKYREWYYKSLLQTQSTYLIRMDQEGRLLFANNAFRSIFEKNDIPFFQESITTHLIEEDQQTFYETLKNSLNEPGKVFTITLRSRDNQETRHRIWEFTAVPSVDNDQLEIQGVGIDQTEKTKLMEQLTSFKTQLDMILSSVNNIVWSCNADTFKVDFINESTFDMLGYRADKFYTGSTFILDIIAEEDRDRFIDFMASMKEKKKDELIYKVRHRNGSYRHIKTNASLSVSSNGTNIINGISTDITDQIEYEIKIRLQNEKLKEIAWIQSHDIRKPLANIMGLIDVIKFLHINGETIDTTIAQIEKEAFELDTKIHDIIDKTYKLE